MNTDVCGRSQQTGLVLGFDFSCICPPQNAFVNFFKGNHTELMCHGGFTD